MSTHHLPPYDRQRGEKGTWFQCQCSDSVRAVSIEQSPQGICLTLPTKIIPTSLARMSSIWMEEKVWDSSVFHPVHCSFINTHAENISSVPELSWTQEHKDVKFLLVLIMCRKTTEPHPCTQPSQSWRSAAGSSPLCKHYCCLRHAVRGVSPLSLNQTKTQLNPGKSSVVLSKH